MHVPEYVHANWLEPKFSEVIRRYPSGVLRPHIEIQLPNMSLGAYVHKQIISGRKNIADVAYTAGMKPDTLRNILYDKRKLRQTEAKGLADAMGCSAEMLVRMIERELYA